MVNDVDKLIILLHMTINSDPLADIKLTFSGPSLPILIHYGAKLTFGSAILHKSTQV